MEAMGFDGEALATCQEWTKTSSCRLQLESSVACKFKNKVVRDVESATKHVTEVCLNLTPPLESDDVPG